MKQQNYSSLIKYYLAYISVALIGCAVIGMIIFFVSVSELRRTAEQSERNRLRMVASDLDTQIKVFETIRDEISGTLCYRPSYLFADRYREMELMQDFKQYNSYSVLCEEYFLYYRGTDSIFGQNAKSPFDLYFDTRTNPVQRQGQYEELQQFLEQINTITVLNVDEETMLLAFPMQLGVSRSQPDAVLCFMMKRSTWLNRVQSVTGGLTSEYAIYYDGIQIAGSSELPAEWDNTVELSKETLYFSSPSGKFIIAELIPSGGWYRRLSNFRRVSLTICAISVAVVLVLSFLAARKNHAPIRQLAMQVQDLLSHDYPISSGNELKQIEHALLQIRRQNSLSQQQIVDQTELLKKQKVLLKQQVLLLVLNGNINDDIYRQLETLQTPLNGPYFCVYILNFSGNTEFSVLDSIELLSDEDQTLYAFRISTRQAAVIGSFMVEQTAEDVKELIQETSAAMGSNFKVQKGMAVDSLEKVPVSYYTAQMKPQDNDPSTEKASFFSEWYPNQYLCLLLEDIRRGDKNSAIEHLENLMDVVQEKYPSILLQRSIVADILSELVRLSYELQVPIPSEESGAILIYQQPSVMRENLRGMVINFFHRLDERNTQISKDLALRIRQYIDQHALEYDISLQKVAESFQLSTKQVNNCLRSSIHQTYKEYELGLRIHKAKELLTRTSLSIVEISQQIGYVDVSSFIKTFKNATGITPAAFRKSPHQASSSDSV